MNDASQQGPESERALPIRPGARGPGQLFVEHLKETGGFHPVIFFGTQLSGKSTILLSLLAYARNHPEMGVETSFGAQSINDIYFDGFDSTEQYGAPNLGRRAIGTEAVESFKAARTFYDDAVPNFNAGFLPRSTQIRAPMYIPIGLKNKYDSAKFLFLEANGEWFARDITTQSYAPFQYEMESILRYYSGPLSIIFVVPVVTNNKDVQHNRMLDDIGRCMELYSQFDRGEARGDNLLLIGSQWDLLPNNGLLRPQDADVRPADFLSTAERWGTVWARFTQMQRLRVGSRAAMPYSIGPVLPSAKNTSEPGGTADLYRGRSVYTQFPRILWNWLYANATQDVTQPGARVRPSLFPDVDVAGFPKPSFFSRAISRFYSV